MLECNNMRRVAVIAVLMLICAGYAHAASVCYNNCKAGCQSLSPGLQRAKCIVNCVFKCAGKPPNSCNLKCTTDHCTGFGNDVNKVEACFNKCDSSC